MSRAFRVPACLSLVALVLAAAPVRATGIDTAASQVGFQLTTRWGEVIDGRFPVFDGQVSRLPDGRHRFGCPCRPPTSRSSTARAAPR